MNSKTHQNIEFYHDIPSDILNSISASERNLVVLDYLMSSASSSKQVSQIFTQEAHHRNLTVIFIVQNVFYRGNEMRTISLNSHYMVLYKYPRDKSQIRYLASQIFHKIKNF